MDDTVETTASSKVGFGKNEAENEARATLRELFLRGIMEFIGEPCDVLTYEKSSLHATFSGWKPDGSDILLHDLETPNLTKIPAALIRSCDVLAVKFKKPLLLR